jgi:predicted nucleic acid-binding protein
MDPVSSDVVVVETSVWVDYFRNVDAPHTAWLEHAAGRMRLGILDLILCEVLQGIRREPQFLEARDQLLRLEVYETGGVQQALSAARNFRSLQRRGVTIRGTIDCMIATYCMDRGFFLLHKDRDFEPFEAHLGLQVVRPQMPSVH